MAAKRPRSLSQHAVSLLGNVDTSHFVSDCALLLGSLIR